MKFALCGGSFASEVERGAVTVHELLLMAKKLGFDAFEVRDDLLTSRKEDLEKLRRLSADAGLPILYASKLWPVQPDLQEMENNIPLVQRAMDEAVSLGSGLLKTGLGPIKRMEDLSPGHLEALRELAALAKERNIVLCLENSDKTSGCDAELIREMLAWENSEYLKTTFDCGNYVLSGSDPLEALQILREHVGYMHLKDIKADGTGSTGIGRGIIDFPSLFRLLRDADYHGYLCLEFAMSMDRLDEIEASLGFCRGIA